MIEIDQTSGTGASPVRRAFNDSAQALVIFAFVKGGAEIDTGTALVAQGHVMQALQDAGYTVCSTRECRTLTAPSEGDGFIEYQIHVGRNVADEAAAE